jgi:hypothetical protein
MCLHEEPPEAALSPLPLSELLAAYCASFLAFLARLRAFFGMLMLLPFVSGLGRWSFLHHQ